MQRLSRACGEAFITRGDSITDPPSSDAPTTANLPVLCEPLIGRDGELEAVRDLLLRKHVGLVTLTGPGGTGKTRLTLHAAADLLDDFSDGVHFVSLASLTDPDLVVSAIGGALGIREAGDQPLPGILKTYLRDRQLLLLLDNFERLLGAAPLVSDLLASSPGLKVLATSRAALRLTGEHEFPVQPLALPDLDRLPDAATLAETASVALFLRRASAARPDFTLTEANAAQIAEICVRLDGLPLALELAAARMKHLSPAALLDLLSDKLKILSGGPRDLPLRQQTLHNTIDWSHDLLSAEERRMFRRLAPFAGGFTLDAAQAVTPLPEQDGQPGSVLETISLLVDMNLLRQAPETGPVPRFRMLETIREYAAERLEESGEADDLRQRHARYYLALAERAEPVLFGGESAEWLVRLEEDHDNLRVALSWAVSRDEPDLLLRLAGALAWFWYDRGHLNEGRRWLGAALERAGEAPAAARAKALIGAGGLAHRQFDLSVAQQRLEAGLELSRDVGDERGSALALINLGLVAHDQGDYSRARRLHEQCLERCREAGDAWGIGMALNNLAWTALFVGDYRTARDTGEEVLALRRDLGDTLGTAHTLYTLGRVAQADGDESAAGALLADSMEIFHGLGDRWGIAACLEALAISRAGERDFHQAVRYWGMAEALRETIGAPLTPVDRRAHERHQDAARSEISPELWKKAWAAGRTSSIDELVAEALNQTRDEPRAKEAPTAGYPAGLTEREVDVLRLIAEGFSNAEAGERLHISPRTVGQHLRSIYGKLGVNSRTAAARFAIEQGLV